MIVLDSDLAEINQFGEHEDLQAHEKKLNDETSSSEVLTRVFVVA